MAAASAEQLKVFISYSRKDSAAFADELVVGLEDRGFFPLLDRQDIAPGEQWEVRLGGLIKQADTVVFVVSPEAVNSGRCGWEIDTALALSKRLLPIVHKPVLEPDIPEKLRELQFVRFDTARGFMRPLRELTDALRVDLDWIREHTRLGEHAARWQGRGQPESLLLRGEDLTAAKTWVKARKTAAPEITEAQRVLISASEEAESIRLKLEGAQLEEIARAQAATARYRRHAAQLLLGFGLLVLGIGAGVGWSNRDYLRARAITVVEVVWPRTLSVEREQGLQPKQVFKECAHCPEMVVVPAGQFMMGSSQKERERALGSIEGPRQLVTIARPFAVGRFEVTSEEWDACVLLGGCTWPAFETGWGRGRRPVMNVNWHDAHQYVAWLSQRTGKRYRLLSEAEWEYAARAGSDEAYSWGDDIGKNNANCNNCGSEWDNKQTAPVGSFAANAFGLYDMHGNVAEWTQDCVHEDHEGTPVDGSAREVGGNCDGRVLRGGSWFNHAAALRAANRNGYFADGRNDGLGFRIARTLVGP